MLKRAFWRLLRRLFRRKSDDRYIYKFELRNDWGVNTVIDEVEIRPHL